MKASPLACLIIASVSALACSPAADPTGKGNVHFQIAYSTLPDAGTCGLPSVGGIGAPPPSLPSGGEVANFGREVVDGEAINDSADYEVKCTVKNSGVIEIEMVGSNDSPSAPSSSGEVGLNVDATISKDTGMGSGTIMVRTTESGATTSTSCELQAIEEGDGKFAIAAGETRFTFVCQNAVSPLAQFDPCETRGSVSVRDCLED